MEKSPTPNTKKIAAISTDEDVDDDFEMDNEPRRALVVPRSKILESIASNHVNDSAAMQELNNDLEESKYNAFLRDSALGLILGKKYQNALSRLDKMKPRQHDQLYEGFLMLECKLHLETEYQKHLDRFEERLLLSTDVECKEILQWGNNLASSKNRLVGWMYLFDIVRSMKQCNSHDPNEYAKWILTPTHEFGLKCYDMLKYMNLSDGVAMRAIDETLYQWPTTLGDISDKRREYLAKFQLTTSIRLCKSVYNFDIVEQADRANEFKPPKYEDPTLNNRSAHKVYGFTLTAVAAGIIHEKATTGALKLAIGFCHQGVEACKEALDFGSDEEKEAAINILQKLKRDATILILKRHLKNKTHATHHRSL